MPATVFDSELPALHRRYDELAVEINRLNNIIHDTVNSGGNVNGLSTLVLNYQREQDELRRVFRFFDDDDQHRIALHPTIFIIMFVLWFLATLVSWFLK